MADVEVNIDPVYVIEGKLGIEPDGPAQQFFTNTCAEHMDKYVPASPKENLASSVQVSFDEIRYPGPYAHYMYEGRVMGPNIPVFDANGNIVRWWSKGPKYYTGEDIHYSTSTHALATSHWAEAMWSAERSDIYEEIADFFKQRGAK